MCYDLEFSVQVSLQTNLDFHLHDTLAISDCIKLSQDE